MQLKQFLTTNRTDSLQYTALIAAYKAHPPTGFELGTSRSPRQCVLSGITIESGTVYFGSIWACNVGVASEWLCAVIR